jgi:hypothetical protein
MARPGREPSWPGAHARLTQASGSANFVSMHPRPRRQVHGASFLALLGLLNAAAIGGFSHTDDGCKIEIHCQACRVNLSKSDGAAPLATVVPVSYHPVEIVPSLPPGQTSSGAIRLPSSRGPPTA